LSGAEQSSIAQVTRCLRFVHPYSKSDCWYMRVHCLSFSPSQNGFVQFLTFPKSQVQWRWWIVELCTQVWLRLLPELWTTWGYFQNS